MRIGDYETHPAADVFPLLDEESFEELRADIAEHGLREPIWRAVVDGRRVLLDGRNRMLACLQAGVEPSFRDYEGGSPTAFIVSLNLKRRHLTQSQRAAAAVELLPIFEAEARERQREHGGTAPGKSKDTSRNDAGSVSGGEAAEHAAQQTDSSPRSVQAAKAVQAKDPELFDLIKSGRIEVGTAEKVLKSGSEIRDRFLDRVLENDVPGRVALQEVKKELQKEKQAAKYAELAANNQSLDSGKKYGVIYADPPWRYEHAKTTSREIENQYPTMDLDEIRELPVEDLATDDAVLFMWATSPKLAEAMSVVESWGFTYRTCMVWDKERMGMGYYARQQHELLLIATKGSPPAPEPSARPSSVIREKRDNKHSRKPATFAEIIEAMYPDVPRVELFCREPREGWDAWGNEAAA